MNFKAPRGTHDILPDEAATWQWLESTARESFRRFGYREIRTPLLEHLELFERGTGETSDVVQKEMYAFEKSDTRYALRPEGTPSVVRAYLQASLDKTQPFQKFFYIGPMFRYERPQAGRQRQFHQLGAEVIGADDALLDAEVILLALQVLEGIGLTGQRLIVNSSGCTTCRPGYRDVLHKTLEPHIDGMCADCDMRFKRNVLRILDCKKEVCRRVVATLPKITEHLCDACRAHFDTVLQALDGAGQTYEADPYLVRGLDYYTRTVFEIHHEGLGARGAICGGGRYDNLVETFGGPSLGCTGFSMGMEGTLAVLAGQSGEAVAPSGPGPDLLMVPVGASAENQCFQWSFSLRDQGHYSDITYGSKSVKAKMRAANRSGSIFVAVVGDDELAAGEIIVKRMETGEETKIDVRSGTNQLAAFLYDARTPPT